MTAGTPDGLTADGRHLYVSATAYDALIERLAAQIHRSGWQFDTVLFLARGGLRPGDVLSRLFARPLAIMSTSSYRTDGGTSRGSLDIGRYIATPRGEIAGRVLLVDDLADTGGTLTAVVARLREAWPAITELRTAVLWVKAVSCAKPDYAVEFLPTSPWIHQPFERYDGMDPAVLAALHPEPPSTPRR